MISLKGFVTYPVTAIDAQYLFVRGRLHRRRRRAGQSRRALQIRLMDKALATNGSARQRCEECLGSGYVKARRASRLAQSDRDQHALRRIRRRYSIRDYPPDEKVQETSTQQYLVRSRSGMQTIKARQFKRRRADPKRGPASCSARSSARASSKTGR